MLFGVLGALASGCAIALAPAPWLAIPLTGFVVYAGGMARAGGAAAGLRGLLAATACAVAASLPVHRWPAPLEFAAGFLGGSLWAVACMVGLWQYSHADRVRRATFAYLHAMSSFICALSEVSRGDARSEGTGRAALRTRLDAMKRIVDGAPADARAAAGAWPVNGERSVALLAGLDSLLAGYRPQGSAARRLLAPALSGLAGLIDAYADATLRGPSANTAVERLRNRLLADVRYALIRANGTALDEEERAWLHSCKTLVMAITSLAGEQIAAGNPDPPARRATAMTLLETAGRSIQSAIGEIRTGGLVSRYALRLSMAAMIAAALARFANVQQGYWLVLTTMFVVQPTVSQTVKVSGLRVCGTVLGAIVASIVALVFHNPVLLALAIVPLATGTFAARAVSYVSYILFLTPHFILVAYLGAPAGSPWLLAALRIGNSLAGAIVAVVVSVIAWPEWERRKLASVSSRAIASASAYLDAVCNFVSVGEIAPGALAAARRNACVAIDELHALAAAMRLEMFSSGHRIACARDLAWHLRRLVGVASPLECLAGAMSDTDRQRLAALGSSCLSLLDGADHEHDFKGNASSVKALTPSLFVRIIEREALASAADIGHMRWTAMKAGAYALAWSCRLKKRNQQSGPRDRSI
ncbi:FUSC family protein [Paraburkholderia ultramafica]|uniref:FUSC family protein n=1 Tax=Paraburkholderia ultramafica TaxID=1544867 RepID=UPI0015822314|nr:FUSC family protein [Paraburkholderia ultramafica]